MQELLQAVAGAGPALEKLSVAGILLLAVWYLWNENRRLKRELNRVYRFRDKWRLGYTLCKAVLDANRLTVDLSPMQQMTDEDEEEK